MRKWGRAFVRGGGGFDGLGFLGDGDGRLVEEKVDLVGGFCNGVVLFGAGS